MFRFVRTLAILSIVCHSAPGLAESSSFTLSSREDIAGTTRTRLHVRVIDSKRAPDSPSSQIPVRVVVTDPEENHPDGFGHGVYADGRFFCEGTFSVDVPPGTSTIRLTGGPNYIPLDITLRGEPSANLDILASLYQWFSPERLGWFSGDNHVHAQHDPRAAIRADLAYTALQGRANGLAFITEAGSHISYENIDSLQKDDFILRTARELRPACYTGHLITPGIVRPLTDRELRKIARAPFPVQTALPIVRELGGVVVYTHVLSPPHQLHWMGATAVYSDAVFRRCANLMDIDSRHSERLWFTVLNLGNKVGCSSYTDCALGRRHTLSPGDRRVYCRAESFSYPEIVESLRRGKTFATNGGPLFPFFKIDDRLPGTTLVTVPGATHTMTTEIRSLYPLVRAELYRNGRAIRTFELAGKKGRVDLHHSFSEGSKSWYLMRVEDKRGHWAITSPIYFEPEEGPPTLPPAESILLEIANHSRFVHLRNRFFAHGMVSLSSGEVLESVTLLRDGQPLRTFRAKKGEPEDPKNKVPVTELHGDYSPGWLWYPDTDSPLHFRFDWPVRETGWYSLQATTGTGRVLASDSLYFDVGQPNSHELSIAHLRDENTRFTLWGYGEDVPLRMLDSQDESGQWWYPEKTYWRIRTSFDGEEQELQGGGNKKARLLFRPHSE